jgi:hypothetical protein
MLGRLQNQRSNFNVLDWKQQRRKQVRLVKQICLYPPQAFSKRKRYHRSKKIPGEDMERRYASTGPNRMMFEMYS